MTERKFISALEVIGGIADYVDLPPHFQDSGDQKYNGKISATAAAEFWAKHNPAIERARRLSIAAMMLKASLSDPKPKAPQAMVNEGMGVYSCIDNKQELGESFYDFVYNRVSGRFQMPSVAELIIQKARPSG